MIIIMMSLGVLDELPCCICLDILYMMCWFDIPIWLRVFFSSFFFPLSHAEITTVQFNMMDLGRNRVMSDIGARWMRPVNSAWSNEPGWVCDCELPSVRIGFSSFDSFSNAGLSKQG